jgi:aerobic-type carbon monoxide dehydrogenase small subunit (CoxS/CutS family)
MTEFELDVNGAVRTVAAEPGTPLLFVLRNDLGLTAAKLGCGLEQCRSCAVLVDGAAVTSCATPIESVEGKRIVTPEGLGTPEHPHRVQRAFIEARATQCGYCIPGMVVGAVALLERTPSPTDAEIRASLAGHLCRCGSHPRIVEAVRRAAESR